MTKKKKNGYVFVQKNLKPHFKTKEKGVWMFIGMMAAYGDSLAVNSSLTLKSNTNVMGGRAMPRETAI